MGSSCSHVHCARSHNLGVADFVFDPRTSSRHDGYCSFHDGAVRRQQVEFSHSILFTQSNIGTTGAGRSTPADDSAATRIIILDILSIPLYCRGAVKESK